MHVEKNGSIIYKVECRKQKLAAYVIPEAIQFEAVILALGVKKIGSSWVAYIFYRPVFNFYKVN